MTTTTPVVYTVSALTGVQSQFKCTSKYSLNSERIFQSTGSSVRVLSALRGETVQVLDGAHTSAITSICTEACNETQVWTSGLDGKICCWDYADGMVLREMQLEKPIVWMGTSNGRLFCILDWNNATQVDGACIFAWRLVEINMETGKCASTLVKESKVPYTAATIRTFTASSENSACIVIAVISGKKMTVYHAPENSEVKTYTHVHRRQLTCVDIDPTQVAFVVGDANGQLIRWHALGDATQFSKLHWHAHAVRDVTFSTDGVFVVSGGEEAVLVLWELQSGRRTFLPRLGSPIDQITPHPMGTGFVLSFSDGATKCVNPITMKIVWKTPGLAALASTSSHSESALIHPRRLIIEPQNGALVFNGAGGTGSIQFYHYAAGKSAMTELDLNHRNHVTKTESNEELPSTVATHMVFEKNGKYAVTVERTTLNSNILSNSLKFWAWDTASAKYTLNSQVEAPHGEEETTGQPVDVSAMAYNPTRNMVVTGDINGSYKIWTLEGVERMQRENGKVVKIAHYVWKCFAVVKYLPHAIRDVTFSSDGSLLAVGQGSKLTVWLPESQTLQAVFSCPSEELVTVQFAGNELPFLIATTSVGIYVWHLLLSTLWWSYTVDGTIESCVIDSASCRLALTLQEAGEERPQRLLLFEDVRKAEPSFLLTRQGSQRMTALQFVPHGNTTRLIWLSADQQLYSMQSEESVVVVTEPATITLPEAKKFDTVYGRSKKRGKKSEKITPTPLSSASTADLFDAPVHLLPSLTMLYRPFMETIMGKPAQKTILPSDGQYSLEKTSVPRTSRKRRLESADSSLSKQSRILLEEEKSASFCRASYYADMAKRILLVQDQ